VSVSRILIVDDDASQCETLSDIFREQFFNVVTANTGKKALEEVKQSDFSVVLIDLSLPDIDGLRLLEDLLRVRPALVCMIITGHASQDNAVRSLELGAHGFFTKPLVIEDVLQRVKMELEKQNLQH